MNPRDLTPREAWKRYVDRRRPETTERSAQTYHYRLKQFVQFCEENDIERVSELTGWTFENYETARSAKGIAPITLNGEMGDLKVFVEYLERIEAVDEGLSEKVHVPQVDPEEESSDKKLATEDARPLLQYYRKHEPASRTRAMFEVFWDTGCRLGALRGLDERDYHAEEKFIEFCHRPDTGTPLKNKSDGERPVALSDHAVDALDRYLASDDRWDKHDDHRRKPLFTTTQGRPGHNTIRVWTYMATQPCLHMECPHDHERETCDYTHRNEASKCPSSRSPHQIRTGSITWQLDCGIPPEVVAARANASVSTIKKHYDKATARERMEKRRRRYVDRLDL